VNLILTRGMVNTPLLALIFAYVGPLRRAHILDEENFGRQRRFWLSSSAE